MPSATLPHDPTLSDSDTNDSDFAASLSVSDSEGSSSGDEDGKATKKRKRAGDDEALASGDEGIVESGQRKKRRKHKKKGKGKRVDVEGQKVDGESEEGVGARLRRRREGKGERDHQKQATSSTEATTIDVDALWTRLNSTPSIKPTPAPPPDTDPPQNGGPVLEPNSHHSPNESTPLKSPLPAPPPPNDMVTIKRTYTFAGTTTTETKLVPRDSAEAQLYLSSLAPPPTSSKTSPTPTASSPSTPTLRRPLKRPSRFDPPSNNDLLKATAAIKTPLAAKSLAELKAEQGRKLNTVEKSRMDWAGYVDKEKLKEELDRAGKAKGGYLERMDFLGRSDVAREEGLREGRRR